MCGIVAVLRRPSVRTPPDLATLRERLASARAELEHTVAGPADDADTTRRLVAAADHLAVVDAGLRGSAGVRALLADARGRVEILEEIDRSEDLVARFETSLDTEVTVTPAADEALNAALVRVKDQLWALRHDRFRTADAVAAFVGEDPTCSLVDGYLSIQVALSAVDRLEVRGRDSAGIEIVVRSSGLDLGDPSVLARCADRTDRLHRSRSVRTVGDLVCFVYKAAAEIGELGDNVAMLRAAITDDDLLRAAVGGDGSEVLVLSHTRWASVGIISEANAHPLDQEEVERFGTTYAAAALNGDVDNFAELVGLHHLQIAPEITTDAKVIPTIMARAIDAGIEPVEAFRQAVAAFEGSVAIGAHTSAAPGRVFLALRGSGQGLYVGLAEDSYVVASEPYGVVEETPTYLRLDGETPAQREQPRQPRSGRRARHPRRRRARRRRPAGLRRHPAPGGRGDLSHAEITTRDIDRGEFSHYLLKEITEAPASFRKTLRAKFVERDGRLHVDVGPEVLPDSIRARLTGGTIARVVVIGQGTAAVAGQSLAVALTDAVGPAHPLRVEAMLATELSGFRLVPDMHDTLVVAISQSGTTTDTNTTVDLARARGAAVIAIVNRRNSDLVDRADGVLYTSDGRDVEMSVASTKAFYAQVAAGFVLAGAIADGARRDAPLDDGSVRGLRELPDAMRAVLDQREEIASGPHAYAPFRRYWAVVGNGREPHRRQRGTDQALGALLQVDRLRCHRGQEAHRPVVGADDHGVRGRARRLERRRRREGARGIYRAHKAAADRHRERGRRPVRRCGRDHHRARGAPETRVRPERDGRAPVRLRGRTGDRRVGASAPRGPGGDRGEPDGRGARLR